jgi:hypothetical protein
MILNDRIIHGICYSGTDASRLRHITLYSMGNPFSDTKSIDIVHDHYDRIDERKRSAMPSLSHDTLVVIA